MAELAEKKKKIYQVAKELNLSHETLIEFLTKTGYAIKSHMTAISDEMMHDILIHFKKDKDVAERHQRKLHEMKEIRQKMEKKPKEIEEDQAATEVVGVKKREVTKKAKPAEKTLPIPRETVTEHKIEKLSVKEKSIQEIAPPIEAVKAEERKSEAASAEAVEEKPKRGRRKKVEGKETEAPPEKKEKKPKVGLKIKGKMDLETMGKVPSSEPEKEETANAALALLPEAEELKKKKKKKKKIREEGKQVQKEEVDEFVRKKKKTKKLRYHEIDKREVEEAIRRTFQLMDDTSISARAIFKRRKKKERMEEEQRMLEALEKEKTKLRVTEFVSVNELANLMNVNVAEVIKKCIELGLMVSINQRLDKDTITLVADEFGFEVEFQEALTDEILEEPTDKPEDLQPRPPVVTIMGHVDHGKTSLLDYIRRSNVVAGEAGGITQHIGAYEVTLDSKGQITFLDTPGHEAFTAMRARGAQLTDIVVLVVAADESVMPQTLEAISHAQAANVPIIIALNKIDKSEVNPDRIRQQLAEKGILVEEWGGKYQSVELSARTGKNVDLLLEKILVEAELLDLRANPNCLARGTIVEAQLDKGKGIVATVLEQKGTLKIGDPFVAGVYSGKVRAMFNERENRVEIAKPSTPVQVTGFDGIPQAGDAFVVVRSDREAREISLKRQQLKREQDFRQVRTVTLDSLSEQIQEGHVKELPVIVKGDVDGSVEALADSLMKLPSNEVKVKVIHRGVGAISESDVLLATASRAVIIGFHVRPNLNARRLAELEKIDIRLYNVIYNAIDDVKKALEGLLAPETKEEVTATVEVREIFKIHKVGTVAGCSVQDGKIARNNKVRLLRDGVVVYDGTIASLKRFKDDVREVEAGFECGIGLENFNDIKVGDIIEAYRIVETKRKL